MFIALRDPRITLGAEFAQRWDVFESADTTRDFVPTAVERTARVISLYTTSGRSRTSNSAPNWPIAIVFRTDQIKPDVDTDPYARNYIAGLSVGVQPAHVVDVRLSEPDAEGRQRGGRQRKCTSSTSLPASEP